MPRFLIDTDTLSEIIKGRDLRCGLHRRGQLISDADILIDATAINHKLHLVTENTDYFRRIHHLQIDSWRASASSSTRSRKGFCR